MHRFWILVFFLLLPYFSMASMPNYNSIIIGDQAAGMGGAYTAMTEDVLAMPFYNPATLAWLQGQAFSSSVGIYKKYNTTYLLAPAICWSSLMTGLLPCLFLFPMKIVFLEP